VNATPGWSAAKRPVRGGGGRLAPKSWKRRDADGRRERRSVADELVQRGGEPDIVGLRLGQLVLGYQPDERGIVDRARRGRGGSERGGGGSVEPRDGAHLVHARCRDLSVRADPLPRIEPTPEVRLTRTLDDILDMLALDAELDELRSKVLDHVARGPRDIDLHDASADVLRCAAESIGQPCGLRSPHERDHLVRQRWGRRPQLVDRQVLRTEQRTKQALVHVVLIL
jgi:hypothetical protein